MVAPLKLIPPHWYHFWARPDTSGPGEEVSHLEAGSCMVVVVGCTTGVVVVVVVVVLVEVGFMTVTKVIGSFVVVGVAVVVGTAI